MPLTLTIQRLRFPNNGSISNPITASLYIKQYYDLNFTLIASGVNVDVDGTVLDSPLPTTTVEPTEKYVLKAVNELCGFEYEQNLIINPYCPVGYEIAEDQTYCFFTEETDATPPTGSENAVSQTSIGYNPYGTIIFDEGYNVNGTGSFNAISYANSFWVNGIGYPSTTGTLVDGPMNRAGIWSSTVFVDQQIGFAACITVPADGIYYVGVSCDDLSIIKIDGNVIIEQDRAALGAFFRANGYPLAADDQMGFNFFYIYPVMLTSGVHVVEMIGVNTQGTMSGNASLACEIYNLTASEIESATSYVDMGAGLIFSSKDNVGNPIEIGTGGLGYECPDGFSLKTCASPFVCTRTITTPILY